MSDKHVLYCKDCLNKEFADNSNKFHSQQTALKIACYRLDVPFYATLYDSIITNNTNFGIGMYLRILNNRQYQYKTFVNSLVDGELSKSATEITQYREAQWTTRDIQNKNRINNILKYDPFEDYDDFSRKFMFNLTSDYLVDENTIEDPHKLQGVIEIVKTYQQVDIINKQIILETNNNNLNENRVKTLTTIKKDLLDSINKFAKDNGISASLTSKGAKGSSSLAYQVKNLEEVGFTESRVNLFDIATCESMRQFSEISNASILKQLRLNADEIGEMSEKQTQTIIEQKNTIITLKEENRLLKIQLNNNGIDYNNVIDVVKMEDVE